jgi:hypothetical protein
MNKETIAEQTVKKVEGEIDKALTSFDTYTTLQESIWKIAFIRDVALARGMNADEEHVGITPDGEQGLGLILDSVGCDLEKVYDNM